MEGKTTVLKVPVKTIIYDDDELPLQSMQYESLFVEGITSLYSKFVIFFISFSLYREKLYNL